MPTTWLTFMWTICCSCSRSKTKKKPQFCLSFVQSSMEVKGKNMALAENVTRYLRQALEAKKKFVGISRSCLVFFFSSHFASVISRFGSHQSLLLPGCREKKGSAKRNFIEIWMLFMCRLHINFKVYCCDMTQIYDYTTLGSDIESHYNANYWKARR